MSVRSNSADRPSEDVTNASNINADEIVADLLDVLGIVRFVFGLSEQCIRRLDAAVDTLRERECERHVLISVVTGGHVLAGAATLPSYPIVRQPTLGEDTQKLEVYSTVADQLGITLEECYRGMYADLGENKRLVRFGHRVSDEYEGTDGSCTTTRLTGDSEESYAEDTITIDWLLTRYNLALAQAVLYDATEMRIRVWDSFATVFGYEGCSG